MADKGAFRRPPFPMMNQTEIEDLDVLIVGAGAAGLTAAYDLHYDGEGAIKFKILEANTGIGGRVQKLEGFADFPIDLGGEWIHVPPDILNNITAEFVTNEIDTVEYSLPYEVWDNGTWTTETIYATDYKFVNYTWFDFFNDYIATDPIKQDHIVLNCQVDYIDWTSTPVFVSCADGRQFTAKHVIVTVSVKILQDKDIFFQPPLPARVSAAIDDIYIMPGLKVIMKFQERFYKENFKVASDYDNVELSSAEETSYFYSLPYLQESQYHVLSSLHVGEPAKKFLNVTTEQEIYDLLLEELDVAYDGQASVTFIEGFVQNWAHQIYVRGAYTNFAEDDDDALSPIPILREAFLNDLVFFAGEAIPAFNYEYGFVHGAALSGRAAAQKVMDLLAVEADADSVSSRMNKAGSLGFEIEPDDALSVGSPSGGNSGVVGGGGSGSESESVAMNGSAAEAFGSTSNAVLTFSMLILFLFRKMW